MSRKILSFLFLLLSTFTILPTVTSAAVIYPLSLISFWRFDEGVGSIAFDSVGANEGTLLNSPVWETGKVKGALSFDGVNDFVQASDSASLDIAGTGITLEAWVYPNSVSQENIILKKGRSEVCDNYNLFIHDSKLALLSSDSCSWANEGPHAIISTNAWQHIAATYDGVSIRYYVNGELKDTIARDGLGSLNNDALTIGGPSIEGWGASRYFAGRIDEAAIIREPLGAEVLRQHYLNGLKGLQYFLDQQEAIKGLAKMVEDMNLGQGIEHSLMEKLDAARGKLEKRLPKAAVNILESFIAEVEALRAKKLTHEQAKQLLTHVKGLQEFLTE